MIDGYYTGRCDCNHPEFDDCTSSELNEELEKLNRMARALGYYDVQTLLYDLAMKEKEKELPF